MQPTLNMCALNAHILRVGWMSRIEKVKYCNSASQFRHHLPSHSDILTFEYRPQHYLICQLVEKYQTNWKCLKQVPLFKWKCHTNYVLFYLLCEKKCKCFPIFGRLRKVFGRFLRLAQISTVWPLIATWSLWDVKAFNQPLATGPGFCFTKDGIPIFCISDVYLFEMLCIRRLQKNLTVAPWK